VRLKGPTRGRISLRTSPGSVSAGSYSHALISSSRDRVELHTGIYVEGGSGAKHEIDVVAIDVGAGRRGPLSYESLRWGMEAKLYAATKALPLSIPRAVLGTAYDLKALPGYPKGGRMGGPPRLALVSSAPSRAPAERFWHTARTRIRGSPLPSP
jgi:hypothetical protein